MQLAGLTSFNIQTEYDVTKRTDRTKFICVHAGFDIIDFETQYTKIYQLQYVNFTISFLLMLTLKLN